jgi:hypothetical protein
MMQAAAPGSFVDATTIGTFGVATTAVFAVSVMIRKVLRINHPVVPAVTSMVLSFGLAASAGTLHGFPGWLIAFVNGALLFCAAVGANETVTDFVTEKPAGAGKPHGRGPVPLFTSFFSSNPAS